MSRFPAVPVVAIDGREQAVMTLGNADDIARVIRAGRELMGELARVFDALPPDAQKAAQRLADALGDCG